MLEPSEPDAFYQRESNWMWKLEFPEDPYLPAYVAENWDINFTVTVFRDAAFDAGK